MLFIMKPITKNDSFGDMAKNILHEDAYELEAVLIRFSKPNCLVCSKKPTLDDETVQEVRKSYAEVVTYSKLLKSLLEKYKGKPPEAVKKQESAAQNFKSIVEADYNEALRLNRHFGASRKCIISWGKSVIPADEYKEIVEKYDWAKIVFGNLAVELEACHPDRCEKIFEGDLIVYGRQIDRSYPVGLISTLELGSQMTLQCTLDKSLSLLPTVV